MRPPFSFLQDDQGWVSLSLSVATELLQPRYPQNKEEKKKKSILFTQQRDSSIYTHTSCPYPIFMNGLHHTSKFPALFSHPIHTNSLGEPTICIHFATNMKTRYYTPLLKPHPPTSKQSAAVAIPSPPNSHRWTCPAPHFYVYVI